MNTTFTPLPLDGGGAGERVVNLAEVYASVGVYPLSPTLSREGRGS